MNRGKKIVYISLCAVPVIFVLFMLFMLNILLGFLGIIVLLLLLICLKKIKPDLFRNAKKANTENMETRSIKSIEDCSININGYNDYVSKHKGQAVFMILSGREDHGASEILINKDSFSIGRGSDNDYIINSLQISRHHLRIEHDPVENVCYAVDVGSSNGTFLNSERMQVGQRYKLYQDNRITMDGRVYVVEYAHY